MSNIDIAGTEEQQKRVRNVIDDIALNPSRVGLTHSKILRDEITRLRGVVAALVTELKKTTL